MKKENMDEQRECFYHSLLIIFATQRDKIIPSTYVHIVTSLITFCRKKTKIKKGKKILLQNLEYSNTLF